MIEVLFDTNVILDVALKRDSYYQGSAAAFSQLDLSGIRGFVSATTVTDIYYSSKKYVGDHKTREFLKNLLTVVDVAGVDKSIIELALDSGIKDFEDAIQEYASLKNNIEIIITRNLQDFTASTLKVLSPLQFVQFLENTSIE